MRKLHSLNLPFLVDSDLIFKGIDVKFWLQTQFTHLQISMKKNPASRAPRARSAQKRVITTKPLVKSKIFTSNTLVKIQFWLLGSIFESKFAKIKDPDLANLARYWFKDFSAAIGH